MEWRGGGVEDGGIEEWRDGACTESFKALREWLLTMMVERLPWGTSIARSIFPTWIHLI